MRSDEVCLSYFLKPNYHLLYSYELSFCTVSRGARVTVSCIWLLCLQVWALGSETLCVKTYLLYYGCGFHLSEQSALVFQCHFTPHVSSGSYTFKPQAANSNLHLQFFHVIQSLSIFLCQSPKCLAFKFQNEDFLSLVTYHHAYCIHFT